MRRLRLPSECGRRYVLAYLEEGALPWQWEPRERVAKIKQKLFTEECAISVEGECDAQLSNEEICSTAHCRATYEEWDCSAGLHALWGCVLGAQSDEPSAPASVDYDECIRALSDDGV